MLIICRLPIMEQVWYARQVEAGAGVASQLKAGRVRIYTVESSARVALSGGLPVVPPYMKL
jgi:hypothetical protein